MKKQYFPILDFWRGFAAISVVIYHLIAHFNWADFPRTGPLLWFRIGWMSVDLFFVISGFVIALSAFSGYERYGDKFRSIFLRNRLARIAPLYFATMIAFAVFIVPELLFENFTKNALLHTLFLHNLFPWSQGAINGANWSVAVEMQFYLLICLFAPFILKGKWWYLLVIFLFVSWAWKLAVYLNIPNIDGSNTFPVFVYTTQLPGMLDEFIFGILLAKFVRSDFGTKFLKPKEYLKVKIALVFLVALFGFGLWLVFWKYASFWGFPWMVVFFRTFLAFFFGLLLLASFFIPTAFVNNIAMRPFLYLGTISYGIYLWHLPVMLSLHKISWLHAERALVPILICLLLIASASWHFFEKPLVEKYSKK